MADETKPKSETTSDGDGKNTADGGTGAATQTAKTEDAKTLTQDEVNKLIAKTKREVEEKHKRDTAEAEQKRQEAADKEAGKHKELADRFEAERDTEKSRAAAAETKYETLAESVSAMIAADIEALPDEVKALAPETLEARLEWLPKAKALAGKFGEVVVAGNPRSPKPKGGKDAVTAQQEIKHNLRLRGGYGM